LGSLKISKAERIHEMRIKKKEGKRGGQPPTSAEGQQLNCHVAQTLLRTCGHQKRKK
jgi:hypothetical protein